MQSRSERDEPNHDKSSNVKVFDGLQCKSSGGKAFKGSIRGHYRFSATLDLCNISAFCVKPPECGGGRRQVDYTRARVSRIKFHGDIYSPASDAFFFGGRRRRLKREKKRDWHDMENKRRTNTKEDLLPSERKKKKMENRFAFARLEG